MVVPGTTWLWLCIIVSSTTVSPALMRRTGGWALSNQPHWVVSSVAGSRCISCRSQAVLPAASDRSGRSGNRLGGRRIGRGCCCAVTIVAPTSQAPPASTPAAANTENLAHLMVSPSANVKSIRTVTQSKGCAIPGASRVLAFFFPGSDHVPRLSGFPVTRVKSPRRGPGPAAASARAVSLVELT